MESGHEGISHCHKVTLAVGLHVVLLAADIDNDLTGLRSGDAEIGTAFLVHLRILIAGDGGLGDDGIGRSLDALGHLDIRALRLITQETGDGLTIAAAQLTITGSVEVQTVRTVRTVIRRNDLCGVQRLRQFVDLLLTTDADTLATGLYDIAGIEVHLLGLQLQVAAEVIIHLLHHTCPLRITGVRLTLMHQDTLDDTVLLSLLGQRDQTLVWIVVVGGEHTLHPTRGFCLHVVVDAVGQETLDVDTADGNVDHTDLDFLR